MLPLAGTDSSDVGGGDPANVGVELPPPGMCLIWQFSFFSVFYIKTHLLISLNEHLGKRGHKKIIKSMSAGLADRSKSFV